MSELTKFLFEGLPVRGMVVRLNESWREVLARRAASEGGAFPAEVRSLLGEMAAAAVLMQANIKFNGALVLQVFGDGPVGLAVAEVQPDLGFRVTAKVTGTVPSGAGLEALLNVHGRGRCAITLDPRDRLPGQQPYQGVVPLEGDSIAGALESYMRQSEQLDTRLWLAAGSQVAAGVLLQKLPREGGTVNAPAGSGSVAVDEDTWPRASLLAGTLTAEELLAVPADVLVQRLFWEEQLQHAEPATPQFACTCSRERIGRMLITMGREEVDSIIAERGHVEVTCDFCNARQVFDAVDIGHLFATGLTQTAEADRPH